MKKITLLTLITTFLSISLFAQDLKFDPETQKITYDEVIEIGNNGASASALLAKATAWVKDHPNYTVSKISKEEGKIYFKGQLRVKYPSTKIGKMWVGFVNYDGKILCKKGRYKYTFTNFVHENQEGQGGSGGALENKAAECGKHLLFPVGWKTIKTETGKHVDEVIMDLKASIGPKKVTPAKDEDNW